MSGFALLKFLSLLAMPLGLLGCGVGAFCVLALIGWRWLARLALTIGIAPTLLLSFEPVGYGLLRSLEDDARAAAAGSPACCYDYIVVLGAGVIVAAPPMRPNPELTDTSDRLWYAARLFRGGTAPRIVVSGGSYAGQRGRPAQTEAEAMRELLVDFGVPADRIVMEGKALNTIENMRNVRTVVGDGKVALVTSAFHMPRALKLARKAGLNVTPFPADWRVIPAALTWWECVVPSIDSLWNGSIAVREYLALWFDRRGSDLAQ
jgi:uncharacterized SAM-binding protein YcdF (DUF218 family)